MSNMELSQAMFEVSVILDNTDSSLVQKIPTNILNKIKDNAKPVHQFKYDKKKKLKEQNIGSIAKGIIALLYRDYFCDDTQRNIYIEYYATAQKKLELEKSKKYNVNNLFRKNKKNEEHMELIPYEKESIWNRIKNKLIRLFR